ADCRRLIMTDVPGPLGVVLGDPSLKDLQYCCAFLARYSRLRGADVAAVTVHGNGEKEQITVAPADPGLCRKHIL
ncbi:MAG: hypothetical protein ACQEQV_07520, partial [Fibrobacterota bacterium]